ncbi:uncharacterized protein TNCV_323281 [Trichonephila clavipes]|nr:uncharacterized protein TNCV_323281 [Trichonephila clavipes]
MGNVRDDRSVSEKIGASTVLPNISPCDFDLIPKIKKPIRGRRFVTREDIANDVHQLVTRFTHNAANAEVDGILCLPYRWQRVVTVAGDYNKGL